MDHRRVSVMPHCIGLEGRAAIDSAGASHGVIVWSAGRSRKLRENQLSKVQDSAAKRVTAKVDRYQLICLNSGNARPAPLHMWQDVSSQDVLENLLAQYCAGACALRGSEPRYGEPGGPPPDGAEPVDRVPSESAVGTAGVGGDAQAPQTPDLALPPKR